MKLLLTLLTIALAVGGCEEGYKDSDFTAESGAITIDAPKIDNRTQAVVLQTLTTYQCIRIDNEMFHAREMCIVYRNSPDSFFKYFDMCYDAYEKQDSMYHSVTHKIVALIPY